MWARWIVVAALGATGCGSSDDNGGAAGGPDYGERTLASLDETCEGVAGLTGQAILDQKADAVSTTLAYVTATGGFVDPTALDVTISWPASPVATCYPAYDGAQLPIAPRIAIAGLGMTFKTADGKFDESFDAKAWLPVLNGTLQVPNVLAVTQRANLAGSWQPFPEYAITGETTMGFVVRLQGASTDFAGGNVFASAAPLAELNAGIFQGSFAMATWPHAAP
jgi:hypothetical protein